MKLVWVLLFILVLPISYASVDILDLSNSYNLGESISVNVDIMPRESGDFLVKLILKCTDKEVLYYAAPVELEESKKTEIEAPAIKAFSDGLCNIKANIESIDGSNIDGTTSKEFDVSDNLDMSFSLDKLNVLPGEEVRLDGVVNKNGVIKAGKLTIRWNGKKAQMDLTKNSFEYDIKLDENIKSGEHKITVEVEDSYGNSNEDSKSIYVTAVPDSINMILNQDKFTPDEKMILNVELLDQAGDTMNGNVNVRLYKKKTLLKDEIILFDTNIKANEDSGFSFSYNTAPDDYFLLSKAGDLSLEAKISILPNPKVNVSIEDGFAVIKNTGNVIFKDKITIKLEGGEASYLVDKKVNLDVDEGAKIDISKHILDGDYDISLVPNKDEDKILDKITGIIILSTDVLMDNPWIASLLMVLIVLSIIFYFFKKKTKVGEHQLKINSVIKPKINSHEDTQKIINHNTSNQDGVNDKLENNEQKDSINPRE
jgi:hypothetical protein